MKTTGAAPIAQSDPGASYRRYREEIDAAVARVLESGWYILGREVEAFESEFAAYLGVGDAVGVANGTDAVELALRAAGIGAGDAVFTVSHTAVATVAAVEGCGATPVLVDVSRETYTMDPARLEEAIDAALEDPARYGRPAALVPVHLYGHAADLAELQRIAGEHGLTLIEDCAQAHGATLAGRRLGSFGRLAAFSFYPTKNLGAFGDGGAVATNDPKLAEKLRQLRQYGWRTRYVSDVAGTNSRLDELQAAILRTKLRHLDEDNGARRSAARVYDAGLASAGLAKPLERSGVEHVYHQYVVRTPARDSLRDHLRAEGIGTAVHYPVPVHRQPAYQGRVPVPAPLAETEAAAAEILSLPMYPELGEDAAGEVVAAIRRWAEGRD